MIDSKTVTFKMLYFIVKSLLLNGGLLFSSGVEIPSPPEHNHVHP